MDNPRKIFRIQDQNRMDSQPETTTEKNNRNGSSPSSATIPFSSDRPRPIQRPVANRRNDSTHLRWMVLRDIPEVSAIEKACFEFSWTEEEFLKCLKQRNCVGMVAERNDVIIGFMIYEMSKNRINLLNLGIQPALRGQNVGRQLIQKLAGKLTGERRNRITCEIRERNLNAQLFLRALGFRAVGILRNFYEETQEDAYVMEYRVAEERRRVA